MIVLRAEELGMCFGVRDALRALQGIERPADVTIHGELVHNAEVLRDLDARGFHRSPEAEREVPATPFVLVTAHGISDRERARLRDAGRRLLDTTCPLVAKAHREAQTLQAEGRRVVVVGRRDHVEVRGIVEDLRDPIVVEGIEDVAAWPDARLGVVSQTTTPERTAAEIVAAIRARNPHADVRHCDTICAPTKARVRAVHDLLQRADAVVVVGGRNSNNTKKLVQAAEAAGVPALHVENAAELDESFLRGRACIGLTAGTSTLPSTVDAVEAALRAFAGRAN